MKHIYLLLAILILISMGSCTHDEPDIVGDKNISSWKLKTVEGLNSKISYSYDSHGRITRILYPHYYSISIGYNPMSITVDEYEDTGFYNSYYLSESTVYDDIFTNSKGYITNFEAKKYHYDYVGEIPLPDSTYSGTCVYNDEGQLQRIDFSDRAAWQMNWHNDNLVSISKDDQSVEYWEYEDVDNVNQQWGAVWLVTHPLFVTDLFGIAPAHFVSEWYDKTDKLKSSYTVNVSGYISKEEWICNDVETPLSLTYCYEYADEI